MLSVSLTHAFSQHSRLEFAFESTGSVTSVLGPSGSGKTSLAHALAGVFRPDRAKLWWGGNALQDTDAHQWVPPQRRGFGVVFQDTRLLPHLTVAENLDYGLRARGLPRDQVLADELISSLALRELLDRNPANLSGGEKQRVALGRALMSSPKALILDEPLASLDPGHRADILALLERRRLPMLHVTHDLDEAARLADHLVLLEGGTCRASGPIGEFLSDLDIAPYFDPRRVGSVLIGKVQDHDGDGLARIAIGDDFIKVPSERLPIGGRVRMRILAQSVVLAVGDPGRLSVRNKLKATVIEIRATTPTDVLIKLSVADQALLAQVTKRALSDLALEQGSECLALTKTVSVYPGSIGPIAEPAQT